MASLSNKLMFFTRLREKVKQRFCPTDSVFNEQIVKKNPFAIILPLLKEENFDHLHEYVNAPQSDLDVFIKGLADLQRVKLLAKKAFPEMIATPRFSSLLEESFEFKPDPTWIEFFKKVNTVKPLQIVPFANRAVVPYTKSRNLDKIIFFVYNKFKAFRGGNFKAIPEAEKIIFDVEWGKAQWNYLAEMLGFFSSISYLVVLVLLFKACWYTFENLYRQLKNCYRDFKRKRLTVRGVFVAILWGECSLFSAHCFCFWFKLYDIIPILLQYRLIQMVNFAGLQIFVNIPSKFVSKMRRFLLVDKSVDLSDLKLTYLLRKKYIPTFYKYKWVECTLKQILIVYLDNLTNYGAKNWSQFFEMCLAIGSVTIFSVLFLALIHKTWRQRYFRKIYVISNIFVAFAYFFVVLVFAFDIGLMSGIIVPINIYNILTDIAEKHAKMGWLPKGK